MTSEKIYRSPTNPTEYWNIVDAYWNDIFHILNIYLPTFRNFWIDKTKLNKTLGEYLIELKDTRNPKLVRAISAGLWNIPEENEGELLDKGLLVMRDLVESEVFLYEELEDV
jgi:hypothetical protein